MTEPDLISVEVAFALPQRQFLVSLQVKKGCSALSAVEKSEIQEKFPEYDFNGFTMGVFSRPLDGITLPLPADYALAENDRVEIYRPLINDPKLARLERVRNEQKNLRKARDKKNKDRKNKRLEQQGKNEKV